MSQCIQFSVTFQYNPLFLVSHKTSCTNFLHLQTLCLKTSTIFFLMKCSFLQRINRGAAGLLGAETIISSKNSDFQKNKSALSELIIVCPIQSGSVHLYRFPKARVHFQNKLYTVQRHYKMKVDTSQRMYWSFHCFPKTKVHFQNKLWLHVTKWKCTPLN